MRHEEEEEEASDGAMDRDDDDVDSDRAGELLSFVAENTSCGVHFLSRVSRTLIEGLR